MAALDEMFSRGIFAPCTKCHEQTWCTCSKAGKLLCAKCKEVDHDTASKDLSSMRVLPQ